MTQSDQSSQPTNILDQKVDQKVSAFVRVQQSVPQGNPLLSFVLGQIRDGFYAETIASLRASKPHLSEAAYKAQKAKLPSFTPCCTLSTRDKDVPIGDKLLTCTGLVHLDFDHLDDPEALKAQLRQEQALAFAFVSPSGDGLKVGLAATGIADDATYKHAWRQVVAQLEARYPGLKASRDRAISYINALCFVSDDPAIYVNPDAVPLVIPVQAPDEEAPLPEVSAQPSSDFDPVEVTRALPFIPADVYDDWILVGQSLHSTGDPLARGLWDWWSRRSTKYKEAAQDTKWQSFTQDGGRTLGDLYTLAHHHGWRPAGWGQEQPEGITSLKKRNYLVDKSTRLSEHSCGEEAPQPITSFTSFNTVKEWPILADEAFHGVAGEIVRTISPQTEADPVALLSQLLTYFGTVIGRRAYHQVGETRHHTNLSICLVGASSRGRKGSAFDYVQACVLPIEHTEFTWSYDNIIGGCGSGEGVINAVRDPVMKHERVKESGQTPRYEEVEIDAGVVDKRLLIYESEFSSVLKVCERENNLLSEVLRKAWDQGQLRNTTKTAPLKATDAHISVIGHITLDELQKTLTTTAAANGFANRFLWVCVKRHGRLPEGGSLPAQDLAAIRTMLRHAVKRASTIGRMERNDEAKRAWNAVWDALTEDRTGLAGAILARAEAQVLRLSMLYALRDGSAVITHAHLTAALALWQYVEASVVYLFGTSLGDAAADTVLAALNQSKKGLTRNHLLTQTLHGNARADALDRVLRLLERLKLVTISQLRSGGRGRPTEMIQRTNNEVNEVNTPDYVSLSNDALKRGYLSNEVIPSGKRGNSQNGVKTPPETPFVPDMTGGPSDGIPFTIPENGSKNAAEAPMREPGEEEPDKDDDDEGEFL